jgi:hypothetical protein
MAFFSRKTTEMKLEAELASLTARAKLLRKERDSCAVALAKAETEQQSFLLGGDLADIKTKAKLQTAVDSAARELTGYDAAIATQAVAVADAGRKLDHERQATARKAASEKLSNDIALIDRRVAPLLDGMRELAALLEKQAALRFEIGAIGRYLSNAAGEIEMAFTVALPDLHGAVTSISEGRERIPGQPETTVRLVVAAAQPQTKVVFALRHVKYTSEQGMQLCGKLRKHTLPLHLAEKALKSGAAISETDSRVRGLIGTFGMLVPPSDQCESLDDTPCGTTEPILSGHFEKHPNVRAPYTIRQPATTPMRTFDPTERLGKAT